MKKMDFSRPHGRLYGTFDGSVYEQDGVRFDGDGNEWKAPAGSMTVTAQIDTGPRPRTKEEEKQYQEDVQAAATLLAAKMTDGKAKP